MAEVQLTSGSQIQKGVSGQLIGNLARKTSSKLKRDKH